MTFLSKISGVFSRRGAIISDEAPARSRTFSASLYREAEVARQADARERAEAVQINAAAVLSPALNPVAEILMAQDSGLAEPVLAAPITGPAPAADPIAWDEAVGWLSQRSAAARNFVGTYWNWDHDLRVLHFLAQQPDLDAGVAAHIFWLTAACEDYFPFGDDEPESEEARQVAWLTDFLGRRFAEGALESASYGFDDSWDCERLKGHLTDLYSAGTIDWSPEAIPTSSQAELMSFDDLPENEREEVGEFLARFGVC
ncbi:MAG TPA: hypothetical protein VNA29_04740 [Sphingomicrobium sp.]|nr:hypothetical protein [Sphingomicrobium sp.]